MTEIENGVERVDHARGEEAVRAVCAAMLLVLGCSSLIPPEAAVRDECRDYDDSYLAWRSVAIAAGGLAGASGTSGVLTSTLADEPGADLALAGVSAVSGILSAVAAWLADEYARRVTRCGEPEP